MKKTTKYKNLSKKHSVNNEKIASEIEKKEIERSYNIDNILGTEAYYSTRYGWTLRKI